MDLVFLSDFGLVLRSDFGLLDGLTQEYGLVFRTLDLVFLLDFGLVFRSDFWTGFSFGLWTGFLSDFRIWFFYRILDTLISLFV